MPNVTCSYQDRGMMACNNLLLDGEFKIKTTYMEERHMQRILNNPDNIVDEMLVGFAKTHSDIVSTETFLHKINK